jgi:hypothetical protein
VCTAIAATALTTLGLAGSASASSELYEKFDLCPIGTEGVTRCIHAVTEGGEVTLGNKTVPIVNDVTLQGGSTAPVEGFSKLIAPTNGVTLSKTPQPVPGGLAGLVNCNEIADFILRAACQWTFENGLTGVNSTLELAGQVQLSEFNLRQKNRHSDENASEGQTGKPLPGQQLLYRLRRGADHVEPDSGHDKSARRNGTNHRPHGHRPTVRRRPNPQTLRKHTG